MASWKFPLNDGGTREGLNDAGIETFAGSPASLVRETIQNALDAKISDSKPVIITYNCEFLPKNVFPEWQQFVETLQSCLEFSILTESHQDEINFFKEALKVFEEDHIAFMKVSDYNTTGLSGSDNSLKGKWFALVKAVGVSNKGDEDGGSFGIGKAAPFECSMLRTVFYNTIDQENKKAFQGSARLVSHYNEQKELTRGTGFFGETNGNLPITEYNPHPFFTRTEIGTDIFIAAFKNIENWKIVTIQTVIENFFVAIMDNKLVVYAGDTVIDNTTIGRLIEQYFAGEDSKLPSYFEAFTRKEPYFFEPNFKNRGTIELYLKLGSDQNNTIAMFRKTGMMIKQRQFRSPLKFSGVFIASGDEMNKLLKKMEPPKHDDWISSRAKERGASKVLSDMYGWIAEQIKSLVRQNTGDTMDLEGISQYLADDNDDIILSSAGNGQDTNYNAPESILIREKKHNSQQDNVYMAQEEAVTSIEDVPDDDADAHDNGEQSGGSSERSDNRIENGFCNGTGHGGGRRNQGEKGRQAGRVDNTRPDPAGTQIQPVNTLPKLKKQLPFYRSGKYYVVFVPETDGQILFSLLFEGEESSEQAKIASAKNSATGKSISINGQTKIGPIVMKANQQCTVELLPVNPEKRAIRVKLHAN
ncbi:hypothetical protein [Paenibacillus jiagnxiensis]|uniref:hypothetical protein n=1 Tax=Paenibacillus jiagnxiensis TaxID=3228926 RepID=UPI0033B94987